MSTSTSTTRCCATAVRQALLAAIDREAVSRQLFEGRQPVAHSFVNPLDRVADPGVQRHGFDPARAQALLEEAGFRPGADGIRVDAAGRPGGVGAEIGRASCRERVFGYV